MSVVVTVEEGDRQMILLSLALCSRLRPGFDDALGRIAELFEGGEMFEEFKRFNDNVSPPPR